MTIFNNYSNDGKPTGQVDEPITVQNLNRFIENYSPEFTQGYMQALEDIMSESYEMLHHYDGSSTMVASNARIGINFKKFLRHKFDLLEQVKNGSSPSSLVERVSDSNIPKP